MIRKPLYWHICKDAAGIVIGESHVYEQLDDDQRDEILRLCDRPIIRPIR